MAKRTKTDPKLAVAYLRVSTVDQKNGPDAQRRAIEKWADANGVTIVEWRKDQGLSGALGRDLTIGERPGLMTAIDDLRRHRAGVLVVDRRDRFGRDPLLLALIERIARQKGARMVAASGAIVGDDDDPNIVFMRRVDDARSEWERGVIRLRTKAALQAKRARGERVGSIPYGFRLADDGTHLEEVREEQAALAQIRVLRGAGRPLRVIVQSLTATGAPPRGKRWHLTTVARLTADMTGASIDEP
jgi:site-specific DNA recombinase